MKLEKAELSDFLLYITEKIGFNIEMLSKAENDNLNRERLDLYRKELDFYIAIKEEIYEYLED